MNQDTKTEQARPITGGSPTACLVSIYPAGPALGVRFNLRDEPVLLGRGSECNICLEDTSVSRRHARITPAGGGYAVEDLQSMNGTHVNEVPVQQAVLKDGDYLRIGGCILRYLSSGNIEADYHQVIYRMLICDALTDTYNRRYLLDFLERELVRSRRHQRPLSLAMLDLDHFKAINDRLGHLGGDHTLREVVARLKSSVRRDELLARYGGEEFAVVLPETAAEGAVQFCERLRQRIEETPFTYASHAYPVSISLGVATTCGNEDMTVAALLGVADEKLYEAKRAGRNRVVW